MLCGISSQSINPEIGHPLSGYSGDIFNTGVHDDIAVVGMYLADGQTSAVVLCFDVLCLTDDLRAAISRAAAKAGGVPVGHVIITTTHTHSGPTLWPGDGPRAAMIRAWLARLPQWAAQATRDARQNAQECDLRHNFAFVAENMNRRFYFPDRRHLYIPDHKALVGLSPEFVDRELGIIAFRRRGTTQQYKAVLTNYTSHPLCVGNSSSLVSSDYQGVIRALMEETLQGCKVMATTGAAGDNHPLKPEAGFEAARSMGANLAQAAIGRMYDAATINYDQKLRIARTRVKLRRKDAATRNMQPATVDRGREPRRKEEFISVECALLGIGPILLVSVPGEISSALGAMIKWSSMFPRAYVLFQGTGCMGYMTTANQFYWGGYECAFSQFAAGESERMIAAIHQAARKLLADEPLRMPPADWLGSGRTQE
jgi:neutral ceramidase